MSKKNERKELEDEINRLDRKYNYLMRNRMVPSPACSAIKREISILKDRINKLDRDAAERLALEKAPVDDVLEIVAIPLLADVMNDLVAGVDGNLRRHGIQETVFGIYTAQIRKAALAMVETLDSTRNGLPNLLDVDDTLIDAIKKKLMSFIKQRLNINK